MAHSKIHDESSCTCFFVILHALCAMSYPQILAPVGGEEQLEAALLYGADAVYLGGSAFNLRAASHGFDSFALQQAIAKAHAKKVAVFYCLNAMPYPKHMPMLEAQLDAIASLADAPDALIIADPGVLRMAQRLCPDIPIHLSTQAHTTNAEAVAFWRDAGVSRVNLARELDHKSMKAIIDTFPDMEFEAFVHGAMCLALSGHCLLSAWVNKRSANLGRCSQPCRFAYKGSLTLEEKMRPDTALWHVEEVHTEQDEQFSSILASDDLCLARYIPWFARVGMHTIKIEGRTKGASYVAQTIMAYRAILDGMVKGIDLRKVALRHLRANASRPLSTGFFLSKHRLQEQSGKSMQGQCEKSLQDRNPIIVARINSFADNGLNVQVREPWEDTMPSHVLMPDMQHIFLPPEALHFETTRGERVHKLHPGIYARIIIDDADCLQALKSRVSVGFYLAS